MNAQNKLTFVTFCWGDHFTAGHVVALKNMLAAHCAEPHRFVCITDKPMPLGVETFALWPDEFTETNRPPNFKRLRLFDAKRQARLGGERIVHLDLDAIVLCGMDGLLHALQGVDFAIMEGTAQGTRSAKLVNPYNGSFWYCRNGARDDFSRTLTPEYARQLDYITQSDGSPYFGSDQAWLAAHWPNEQTCGEVHGLFQHRSLAGRSAETSRVVFFAGRLKPWSQQLKNEDPRLAAVYRAYQRGAVLPHRPAGEVGYVLGVGDKVWSDYRTRQVEGVPASRWNTVAMVEVADSNEQATFAGVCLSIAHGARLLRERGCTEVVYFGDDYIQPQAKFLRVGRGQYVTL